MTVKVAGTTEDIDDLSVLKTLSIKDKFGEIDPKDSAVGAHVNCDFVVTTAGILSELKRFESNSGYKLNLR